jgi:hypothetical protein
MLSIGGTTRVFLATAPVDLRASFNRLYGYVAEILREDVGQWVTSLPVPHCHRSRRATPPSWSGNRGGLSAGPRKVRCDHDNRRRNRICH